MAAGPGQVPAVLPGVSGSGWGLLWLRRRGLGSHFFSQSKGLEELSDGRYDGIASGRRGRLGQIQFRMMHDLV